MNLDGFLDDLERSGYWDDTCSCCGDTFANTDPTENPETLCQDCQEEDND